MSTHELSRTQRLFARLVDAPTFAAMEAHSRAWFARCLKCGHRRSIWDHGGLRYKATGRSLTRLPCPSCGKTTGHKLEKGENFPVTNVPSGSLWRAIILVTFVTMLVLGAIVLLILWAVGVL
jgi:ribosomal protein S27E